MSSFSSFQNILPDPNNTIGTAGQVAGSTGPGYASVKLSSENQTLRSRTNSGRLIARAAAYHSWKVDIGYNPMTRVEFERIYNFLIQKRGSLTPFFVSLPQYRIPQNGSFATYSTSNNMEAASDSLGGTQLLVAGSTSIYISKANFTESSRGTPSIGDLFTIDGINSNHKKAYMVTRVETNSDYYTGTTRPSSTQVKLHFTPGLAKSLTVGDDIIFNNPLIKVVLTNDIQEYSLGVNGLYQFGLQLEEVQ